jgi:hypothetical protein
MINNFAEAIAALLRATGKMPRSLAVEANDQKDLTKTFGLYCVKASECAITGYGDYKVVVFHPDNLEMVDVYVDRYQAKQKEADK